MKTIQMALGAQLVLDVDQAVRKLGTTRSAFAREAPRHALSRLRGQELERQHLSGYQSYPVQDGEVGDWETEQVWGD